MKRQSFSPPSTGSHLKIESLFISSIARGGYGGGTGSGNPNLGAG
ncbi:MAG: hypothetical protein ACHQU0_02860 [Candidatus Paceibacteria bacterium]